VGDIVYNDNRRGGIPPYVRWERNPTHEVARRFQAQKHNEPYATMAASNRTTIIGVWDDVRRVESS